MPENKLCKTLVVIAYVILAANATLLTVTAFKFAICVSVLSWYPSILFIFPLAVAWLGVRFGIKALKTSGTIVESIGVIVLSQFIYIVVRFVLTPIGGPSCDNFLWF